jgi:hypothetical protein
MPNFFFFFFRNKSLLYFLIRGLRRPPNPHKAPAGPTHMHVSNETLEVIFVVGYLKVVVF